MVARQLPYTGLGSHPVRISELPSGGGKDSRGVTLPGTPNLVLKQSETEYGRRAEELTSQNRSAASCWLCGVVDFERWGLEH